MKKVLVIGLSNNLGGVECFIMNYFRNINRNKIHMDFLIYEEHCVFEDEIIKRGSKIYKIREPRYKKILIFRKKQNDLFRHLASEYDCIWMNDCSLAHAFDLRIAQKYGFKRRIFHSHNNRHMRNDKKKKFYELIHNINKLLIGIWATDFWACSEDAGKFCFLKKEIESNRFKVIPNAIEMEKYYYNPSVRLDYRNRMNANGKIIIGNVGRLHFQKNQSFLIDIFSIFAKSHIDSELWIIGDGEDKEKLMQKVHSLELDSKVKFMGIRNDVPNLMQAMDIFLFPSIFEGLGIALVEAQTEGLRVFASDQVIPQSVKITELLTFVSLEDNAEKWSEIIEKNLDISRENMKNELEYSEYNIKYAAKELENLLG